MLNQTTNTARQQSINSTTAQVNLSMFGGANVTFNNAPPGITVQNIVTDIPPDSDWDYLITDLNSTIVYKNFTLPAGGGTVTFTDTVFLNGGQFLVTATSKYGYSPDVTAVCSNGTAVFFSKLQVLLTIVPRIRLQSSLSLTMKPEPLPLQV